MSDRESVVRLSIEGQVQGVGYRAFVARRAAALGLRGFVRNLAPGGVEALVAGPGEKIDALVEACWIGPRLARVSDVRRQAAATADAAGLAGFIIAPDGAG
jgi:acylphosphatase